MNDTAKTSALALGNNALRDGDFCTALAYYRKALSELPQMKEAIAFNIALAEKGSLGESQTNTKQPERISRPLARPTAQDSWSKIQGLLRAANPIDEHYQTILKSGAFDHQYYLSRYPDVATSNIDPIAHYCAYGWQEYRNPSENFNTHYYLAKNPDVANAGVNPFVHWIKYGKLEGRKSRVIEVSSSLSLDRHSPTMLFVSHEASQTGAPAVLLSLMRWVKANTSIKFSILVGASGPWDQRFKDIGPCFFFDAEHPLGFEEELKAFCGSEVSSIYANTIAAGTYVKHLDFLHAELITHVHEMENVFDVFADSFKYLKEKTNQFIAVSQGSIDALNKRLSPNSKIHFLKPFIEKRTQFTTSYQRPSDKIVIFGCGAVEKRKGFDLFCAVAAELLAKGFYNFKMLWVGSAEGKDLSPKDEIQKYNVDGYVEWLGSLDNVRDHFAGGHIFLLPSREDPYPLVCMEAAECGMPVVCFDSTAGGMHSFVETDAGIVVDYLDVIAMADAVIRLASDEPLRENMGNAAAKKVAERHYVSVIAPQIMKLVTHTSDTADRLSKLKKFIDNAKVVSFDIFDTLVTRRIGNPAVAFDLMEHRHTAAEPALLSLFSERMNTAGKVLASRQGKVDDITVDEIYNSMSFFTASDIEKDTEISLCIPHPLGIQLYNYARKKNKTIFIASDMYLDQQTIEKILRNCGINKWDEFFLSSSLGKKKDTGKLFTHLLVKAEALGYKPKDICHIGDNWVGDVLKPREQHIIAKRFAPLNEVVLPLVPLPKNISEGLSQAGRIWESFCTQSSRIWHKKSVRSTVDFYTKLGFELTGPLAAMMAMHTAGIARNNDVKKIVFMARDGRIIKKAFDTLYADEIANSTFESLYLHLSRATVVPATFSHPLTSNDIAFLTEGLHLGQKPVQYFIEKAGLDPAESIVCKKVFSRFDSMDFIPTWNDLSDLSALFKSLSAEIHEATKPLRDSLLQYLNQNGLLDDEHFIVVDVGWLLNIHSRLAKFISAQNSATKITGCYVGSRDRADKSLTTHSLLFHGGEPRNYARLIEDNTTLFEVLFSAPEASAKGLTLDPETGKVLADFKPLGNPVPPEIPVAQKLHMGAESFFEMLADARRDFFPEVISRDYFFHVFEALVSTHDTVAKAHLGSFEVRLGGHHEFIAHENLIKHSSMDTNVDFKVNNYPDEFIPLHFNAQKPKNSALIVTSAGLFNGSTRYRGMHLAESLKHINISSTLVYASLSIDAFKSLASNAKFIIFQRCLEDQGNVAAFLAMAKSLNKICIGEMDDLVFPEHLETIGSVKGGEWNIQEAQYVAEGYEKLIKKMDCCIASTPALKTYIEESYSKPTLLLRNAITPEMVRPPKSKDFKRLNLLYASGTYSHKADFMMVEELLFQTLRSHPEVKLSILGAAQASERMLSLDNVSSYPLLPYESMLDFIAKHDMLLVPLEDSIFNRAKSNVKFIEAAAMGVPVLASAVGEFSQSITHGSNGFLAHDVNDWRTLLNEIIQKPKQLKNISKNANQTVKKFYLTTSAEHVLNQFLELAQENDAEAHTSTIELIDGAAN